MLLSTHPTYSLRPRGLTSGAYLPAVSELADWVLAQAQRLDEIVARYADHIETTGREQRRTTMEYQLEALMIGVLWRAHGSEATWAAREHGELLRTLLGERRAGCPRRRDGSATALLGLTRAFVPGAPAPTCADFERLLDWLCACGEYDDELARLSGWQAYLKDVAADADAALAAMVELAVAFEGVSEALLGAFTNRVDSFVHHVLPRRGSREDTVQCARRRVEYHVNMVGAEILNRAWRADFLACGKHVVVMPGCARRRDDSACAAHRSDTDLRCTHCDQGCTVSAASRLARDKGATAVAVRHGSDFGRFLRSPELSGGNVGIVGVACVSGLVGAGWRARALGMPAQCVLLDASGCAHWRERPVPTAFDFAELARILSPDASVSSLERVA
jgi:hypothetical protein